MFFSCHLLLEWLCANQHVIIILCFLVASSDRGGSNDGDGGGLCA